MTVHETFGPDEKRMLRLLHDRHEAVIDVLEPFVDRMEPYLRALTELPYFDRLPTPRETVDEWFGFADEVLKEERRFLLRVVDLLPEHKVTPVTKEPRKVVAA